ncbi:hypothetical protein CI088_09600, partial [Enterococcus plantarum]
DREYRLIDLGYGKMWLWVKKGKTSATAADIDVTLACNKWLSRMSDKYGLSFIQGNRQKGVDELFYEQNATLIKELATGIDSVTGKKLTQAEMLGKASLLANGIITIGVMVKGVINVGKTQSAKPRNTNKKASGADIPKPNVGVVQSRINVANGPTRFSSSENAGFNHVLDRHFNPNRNAGQFTISQDKLKNILSNKNTVNIPVKEIPGNQFERIIDIGEPAGTIKPSIPDIGGTSTNYIRIITDKAGNLITTYPIPKP